MYPFKSSAAYPPLATWLEHHIQRLMAQYKLPGFSIAVVHDGAICYADGFGARDPQRNLPATAETLYGIGSVTKSFVAMGILQLAETGTLPVQIKVWPVID